MEVNGLSGLDNIGNTCFFNAALQCLSGTKGLCSYLLKKKFIDIVKQNRLRILKNKYDNHQELTDETIIKKTFTFQLYRIIKGLWEDNCTVMPKTLHEMLMFKHREFYGLRQCDSHEFLIILLDELHEECKKQIELNVPSSLTSELEIQFYDFMKNSICKDYSFITRLFYGISLSTLQCSKCSNIVTTFEKFMTLPLAVSDKHEESVYDCITRYGQDEMIDCACEKCKSTVPMLKKIFIWESPKYLIIHLKRFSMIAGNLVKNNIVISSPINITITSICKRQYNYRLYAVIQHSGSMRGGHYVAYVNNIVNKKWYLFNDSSVNQIPNPKDLTDITAQAYILFYVKE